MAEKDEVMEWDGEMVEAAKAGRWRELAPFLTLRRNGSVAFNRAAVRTHKLDRFLRVKVYWSGAADVLIFQFLDKTPKMNTVEGVYRVRWNNVQDRLDMSIEIGAFLRAQGVNPERKILHCPIKPDPRYQDRLVAFVGKGVSPDDE